MIDRAVAATSLLTYANQLCMPSDSEPIQHNIPYILRALRRSRTVPRDLGKALRVVVMSLSDHSF